MAEFVLGVVTGTFVTMLFVLSPKGFTYSMVCLVGHHRDFWGPFARRRSDRWWVKHQDCRDKREARNA